MNDTVTFTYNHEHQEWEYDYEGTVYSFDTFIDAATDYNARVFENA